MPLSICKKARENLGELKTKLRGKKNFLSNEWYVDNFNADPPSIIFRTPRYQVFDECLSYVSSIVRYKNKYKYLKYKSRTRGGRGGGGNKKIQIRKANFSSSNTDWRFIRYNDNYEQFSTRRIIHIFHGENGHVVYVNRCAQLR